MPQSYKGYEIPAYTDDADAVKAFQDYTDSVSTELDNKASKESVSLKADLTGGPSATSDQRGLRNITISTSAPSGGSDGDVWIQL